MKGHIAEDPFADEENGVKRWMVNIHEWHPSPHHLSFLLSLLPPHEQPSVTRLMKMEDKKRALVSRLLQYSLVHEVLHIPFDEININRTPQGKPYLKNTIGNSDFSNFNFSASHCGDYVGITSDPACVIGMDIVCMSIPYNQSVNEFLAKFKSYFTNFEWKEIMNAGTELQIVSAFKRSWCLKEAYIKAVGAGCGCMLDKLEFHHDACHGITLYVDGVKSRGWSFWLLQLDSQHWAAIARGPRDDAQEGTTQRHNDEEEEHKCGHLQAAASFVLRRVEETQRRI